MSYGEQVIIRYTTTDGVDHVEKVHLTPEHTLPLSITNLWIDGVPYIRIGDEFVRGQ